MVANMNMYSCNEQLVNVLVKLNDLCEVHHKIKCFYSLCKYLPLFFNVLSPARFYFPEALSVQVCEWVGRIEEAWPVWEDVTVLLHY